MKNISMTFVLFFYLLIGISYADDKQQSINTTLTFGVVPQQSASKLARLWTPILQQISAQTGVNIKFRTAKNIPTFEKRVLAGEYDFAYMNPYHFTVYSKEPGYKAFAKALDKKIKGIIVIKKDSKLSLMKQLSGQQLAFPAPAAFAATVLPRAYFAKQGISISEKYVSSHDSVYRGVAKGLFPAGGGVVRTFKNMQVEIRDQLKILWISKGYTPHAFAVHPRVNSRLIKKVQAAFIALNQSEQGKKLLYSIKLKGITKAKDVDWDDVRGLNIDLLGNKR
ncbi:MAG: phosphate/phosphite/phosphonate ABC transporter substrate-binding protein [Pseudomonadota bacterium]